MALDYSMLQTAVRITSAGGLQGTGFLITVPSEKFPRGAYRYVVTAHHVIRNQIEIAVEAPNPFANGALYPPVPVSDWRQPLLNVDLAIAGFPDQPDMAFQATRLETTFIPGPNYSHSELGAPIFYIGIFEPLDRPMARSGRLGALDQEGIPHKGGYVYPAHLVDCRSYDGFSGSPCFELVQFAELDQSPLGKIPRGANSGKVELPKRVGRILSVSMLAGMFTAHYTDTLAEERDGLVSRYGVGVMLRGAEIREALMSEELKADRRAADATVLVRKKGEDNPTLENVSTSEGGEEFERFEDLTRQLLQTPKAKPDDR